MARRAVILTLVGALVLILTSPVLAHAAGSSTSSASWGVDRATLIDVHAIHAAPARHGKPGPSTANCSNDGSSNGQYTLTGWTVQASQVAHLNAGTIPGGLSQSAVVNALSASFAAWHQADGAAPTISVATDGTTNRQTANHRYDLLWGHTSGSAIAVTYTWMWSDGSIESDTVFNNRLPWFTASSEGDGCYENQPSYDVRNIATHEFGHTYGLGHASSDRFETMYPYGYTGETLKWSPANGDVAGIRSLY